jgi:hypothetical protein
LLIFFHLININILWLNIFWGRVFLNFFLFFIQRFNILNVSDRNISFNSLRHLSFNHLCLYLWFFFFFLMLSHRFHFGIKMVVWWMILLCWIRNMVFCCLIYLSCLHLLGLCWLLSMNLFLRHILQLIG